MKASLPFSDIAVDPQFYLAVLLGLCLGSLATAMAYRLPRGISMITQESSHCPMCNRMLRFWDLFPILSWLVLRGKCRGCKQPFGLRYLGIEVSTLLLCLLFYFFLPQGAPLVAFYLAAPVLVAHVAVDFEWQLLLDKLNLALAALAVLAIVMICGLWPLDARPAQWGMAGVMLALSVGGAVIYGAFSAALRWGVGRMLGREPMGLGDVKFFAAAGMWMGIDITLLSHFMIASGVTGMALGVLWRWRYGAGAFPFGPALIISFAGMLLAGQGLFADPWTLYGNFL